MAIEPVPAVLMQRLDPQERVLWWGRPKRGIMFRISDLVVVPFSIIWCGGVLVGGVACLAESASWFCLLFVLVFLAVGLYVLVGRFIHDAWRRGRVFFAVTPTRALIVTRRAVNSIELGRLSQVSLRESRDGSGSIVFGPEIQYDSGGETVSNLNGAPAVPTFERIPAAGQVYAMIRGIQADLARPG